MVKEKELNSIFEFYQTVNRLKGLKRSGWIDFNIKNPESVADHTFGLSMLVFAIVPRYGYNLEKCLTMALVHDLAEAMVGDITPRQGISSRDKLDMEADALAEILTGHPDQERLMGLWREVALGNSPEGRLVKDLDKLEMAFQAFIYEKGQDVDLAEFFNHCLATIKDEEVLKFLDLLLSQREEK